MPPSSSHFAFYRLDWDNVHGLSELFGKLFILDLTLDALNNNVHSKIKNTKSNVGL